MSTMSRRERLLAGGAVFAVSLAALVLFVLGPWWTHTHTISREIARLEGQLRQHQQVISRHAQLTAEAEAAGAAYEALTSGAMDMAAVLRELEALGTQSGINLGEVKPIERAASGGGGSAVDVQYHGSFKAWIHFLYVIQTSPSLFHVERAMVALKDAEAGVLEGSLRLTSQVIRPAPTGE